MRLHLVNVVCLGAGFVGQLVQWSLSTTRLLDARPKKPVNHLDTRVGPQYLWEPIPGVSSISFPVTTKVDGAEPTEASILSYKKKIGKEYDGGDWGLQFQPRTVGWHSALPVPRVEYNRQVEQILVADQILFMADGSNIPYDLLINTIPLDLFLSLCDIPPIAHAPLKFDPIYLVTEENSVSVEGMILNYIADPEDQYYRETKIGRRIFYESLHPLPESQRLVPGKIHPHSESEALIAALRLFNIHSFGRYATWRPDELAHETWRHITAWKGSI
jgi:hypothetical protein